MISMRTYRPIIILGVLVALVPYIGIPFEWRNTLLVFLGVMIIFFGLVVRHRSPSQYKRVSTDTYTEQERDTVSNSREDMFETSSDH